MIRVFRTASCVILCIVAILFLPWWIQIVCFVGAVFLVPVTSSLSTVSHIVLLVLAAIGDTVFSRNPGFHIHSLVLFGITLVAVVVQYVLIRYTRLAVYYETKNQKNRGF